MVAARTRNAAYRIVHWAFLRISVSGYTRTFRLLVWRHWKRPERHVIL